MNRLTVLELLTQHACSRAIHTAFTVEQLIQDTVEPLAWLAWMYNTVYELVYVYMVFRQCLRQYAVVHNILKPVLTGYYTTSYYQ